MRTVGEFVAAALARGIERWPIRNCSLCHYELAYLIRNGQVFYDTGCHCTYQAGGPVLRSFTDIAHHYNIQRALQVIERYDKFWGFSSHELGTD